MMRVLLPTLLLAAPALAQIHEAVGGATAGRSPHAMHRELRPTQRPCGLTRHTLPAGKLPVLGTNHPCPTAETIARAPAGEGLFGR